MSTAKHLITYEESLTMPESNLEEVVDGELLTIPPATRNHSAIVSTLHELFLLEISREFMAIEGTGYLLQRNPLRYRIPDLAIVNRAIWKKDIRTTTGPYSHIVPELAIEIVSPSNRRGDLERLRRDYADFKFPRCSFSIRKSAFLKVAKACHSHNPRSPVTSRRKLCPKYPSIWICSGRSFSP